MSGDGEETVNYTRGNGLIPWARCVDFHNEGFVTGVPNPLKSASIICMYRLKSRETPFVSKV